MNRALLLLLGLVGIAFGQRDRATLTGLVTDSTGAVAPGAMVTIVNTDSNAEYKAITTDAGAYTVPNLPVGPYRMELSAAGFKKMERLNIQLTPGQVQRVDFTLQLGTITESIQVTTELSKLETETPRVAVDMTNSQVRNMPISLTATTIDAWVAKITPGVGGNVYNPVVNGVAVHNAQVSLIDGLPAGSSEQNSFQADSPGMMTIAEFNVQTAGYSAEYGRVSNGVYNYVMRSGSNQWHGGAFGALRNEALNANTFTNNFNGLRRGIDRRQRWAFSLGGPVLIPKVYNGTNKTFFFASYDRYRNHSGANPSANAAYPIPDFYDGDFSRLITDGGNRNVGTDALGRAVIQGMIYDPMTFEQLPSGRWIGQMFPNNRIPVSRFSAVSQNINKIGKAQYLPTYRDPRTGLLPLTQNAWAGGPSASDQINWAIKIDRNVSDRHKLAVAYDYSSNPNQNSRSQLVDPRDPTGGPFAQVFIQDYSHWRARINEDWTVSPRVFNHFGITYNRGINDVHDANTGINGAAVYGIKGLETDHYPAINWGGGPIWSLRNPTPFSLQGIGSQWYMTYTTWAFRDALSYSRGRHFVKVGYENWNWFYHGPKGPPSVGFNFSSSATTIPQEQTIASFTGYSFASYLLGMVHSVDMTPPAPRSPHGLYHALYFQDDFKFRPTLTLNIGLRYDYNPLSYEAHDRITSWTATKIDPLVNLPGAYEFAGKCSVCTGKRNFGKRDFNNFGPRVGFAWQVRKDVTVRGSYTITYIGDDSGTALGSTPGFTTGGMGPDIVGTGSFDFAPNALYPWQGIFNWDNGLPANRFVPAVRNPSYADTIGNADMVDPRYGTTPYVQQWNFNVQKELPGGLMIDIGYIGNKSTRLRDPSLDRLNQTPTSVISQYGVNLPRTITSAADAARYGVTYPYAGFQGTVNSALRQFPQLRANNTVSTIASNNGMANYHAFNLIANRRFSKGLSIYANWVWSKTMDNLGGSMLDYYNRELQKQISGSDRPHVVKIFAQYELPVGRGRSFGNSMPKLLDAMLGGWEASVIANYSSGAPMGFSGAPGITGWNGGANRVNVASGELRLPNVDSSKFDYANRLSKPAVNQFFDTTKITAPAPLTFGTAAQRFTYFRGWGSVSEDIGLRKNFRIKEKYVTAVRADFLNAFNRHSLSGPNTGITSAQFGYMTGNPSGNRAIEVSLKLDF